MDDVKYVTGLLYVDEKISELALGSWEYIHHDLMDIRHNYIKLGFHLVECDRCNYWADFGYTSFADFVYDNFKLDKSALSRCISVYRRFSDHTNPFDGKMWLDEKYEGYSYSQLCEMVSMPDSDMGKVSPDMTVQQIRDLKKELKRKKIPESSSGCDVATDGDGDKKLLDYARLISLSGAAKSSYLKSVDALRSPAVAVYDKNGRYIKLLSECPVDVLYDSGGRLVLRISLAAHPELLSESDISGVQ